LFIIITGPKSLSVDVVAVLFWLVGDMVFSFFQRDSHGFWTPWIDVDSMAIKGSLLNELVMRVTRE